MSATPQLPEATQRLCDAFAGGLRRCLGEKLRALYVYGAAVFPETKGTGDVDLHAILDASLAEAEKGQIQDLHAAMSKRFPPLGAELDVYYILLDDALKLPAPPHQLNPEIVDDAWALHRAHMLAGRCVVLHGPEPGDLFASPTWDELDRALQGELDYVKQHLAPYPDYCILNLCRLMYSYQTRDVVTSKFASAEWAAVKFPEWRQLIDMAQRSYTGESEAGERAIMRREVARLVAYAGARIETARKRPIN